MPRSSSPRFTPINCNCTVNEILDTDPQPQWHDTLHQPGPATEDEHRAVAELTQARDEGVLNPRPVKPPKPAAAVKPPAAARPAKPPKPKPAPKPARPAWRPGEPIDADRPIGERIAAADHLEAKRAAILDVGRRASGAIAGLEAELAAVREEIRAQAARWAELRETEEGRRRFRQSMGDLNRREAAILDGLAPLREAEADRVRREVAEVLDLAKGDRAAWTHHDGPGFKGRTTNVATRAAARDWLESKAATGPKAPTIEVRWESRARVRAYANKDKSLIMVKADESASTMVHEMGHHVEYRLPGARKAAQDFLAHRVKDQALVSLRKVISRRCDADEMGRDDDFARAFGARDAWYVGKHYPSGSTEILSMGIEKLYNDPVGFAKSDPEYCKFILGVLDGSMRTPAP